MSSLRRLLQALLRDELHDVTDGALANLVRLLVGHLDVELLFDLHHDLDEVEGVGIEALDRRVGSDGRLLATELLRKDVDQVSLNLLSVHTGLLLLA